MMSTTTNPDSLNPAPPPGHAHDDLGAATSTRQTQEMYGLRLGEQRHGSENDGQPMPAPNATLASLPRVQHALPKKIAGSAEHVTLPDTPLTRLMVRQQSARLQADLSGDGPAQPRAVTMAPMPASRGDHDAAWSAHPLNGWQFRRGLVYADNTVLHALPTLLPQQAPADNVGAAVTGKQTQSTSSNNGNVSSPPEVSAFFDKDNAQVSSKSSDRGNAPQIHKTTSVKMSNRALIEEDNVTDLPQLGRSWPRVLGLCGLGVALGAAGLYLQASMLEPQDPATATTQIARVTRPAAPAIKPVAEAEREIVVDRDALESLGAPSAAAPPAPVALAANATTTTAPAVTASATPAAPVTSSASVAVSSVPTQVVAPTAAPPLAPVAANPSATAEAKAPVQPASTMAPVPPAATIAVTARVDVGADVTVVRAFMLSNPRRAVVDVSGVTAPIQKPDTMPAGVVNWRSAPQKDGAVRIVLDLGDDVRAGNRVNAVMESGTLSISVP